MLVKISQAVSMISVLLKARLVPMLLGSPGMGKSQLYQQIAEQYNLLLVDVRLGQCDVTDLCGFPTIKGNKASYVPMDTFPIEGDPIPEGYSGWMILFDELTSAPPAIQAAAYKIILDRKVGLHNLHSNVALCAAGNLETDNAVVHPMSTALQSRMVHLELMIDQKEWNEWAVAKGIDHRITSYMSFKPGNICTFEPEHVDKTYACPRTWEFADRIMKITEDNSPERLPLLAGTLSEGVAREFLVFCKIHESLPKMSQIEANPTGIAMPQEPSILYALSGALSHNATATNLPALMKFICRMPIEFQVVTLKDTFKRHKALFSHPAAQDWKDTNASELF